MKRVAAYLAWIRECWAWVRGKYGPGEGPP